MGLKQRDFVEASDKKSIFDRSNVAILETAMEFKNGTFLSGLWIIDGRDTPPPGDFVKIPVDLNEGAHGAYLYLCAKGSSSGGITDLFVANTFRNGTPSAPEGYALVNNDSDPVDLNRGARGDYLWLSYARKAGAAPIRSLGIAVCSSESPNSPPPGYTRIPQDLNAGAGGTYIYIDFKK